MVAICGGGTSGPKILPELAVAYSAGRLAQLLLASGIGELSAWLPLVGVIPVVYSSFCASDPPAMVALTQAESDALANNTFGTDFLNGLGKFKDVLLNLIWLDVCQCTSGALATPTIPAVDPDTPVFKPPVPVTNTPCIKVIGPGFTQSTTNSNLQVQINLAGYNATAARITISQSIASGAGVTAHWIFEQDLIADTPSTVRVDSFNVGPTASVVKTFTIAPTTNKVTLTTTFGSGSGTTLQADTVEIFCNGDVPGAPADPCCPPDVTTQAYLDLILAQVNLIQRQSVPFSYVSSTAHSGLTGAGSINIQGLLGAKVHVSTLPSSYGVSGTSPGEHFDLGFLTFGTADGFPSSYRLERVDQLLLPARCSAYTVLDYDLAPGVVVTITELLREP